MGTCTTHTMLANRRSCYGSPWGISNEIYGKAANPPQPESESFLRKKSTESPPSVHHPPWLKRHEALRLCLCSLGLRVFHFYYSISAAVNSASAWQLRPVHRKHSSVFATILASIQPFWAISCRMPMAFSCGIPCL